jgi:ketosteroid isomerase-like protein
MNAVLLALVPLLGPHTLTGEDPADVLRAADRAFCAETRARGVDGWLAWFADDAIVFPPNGALAVGRDEVDAHYRGQPGFPAPGFTWEPERAGITTAGDLGWTVGRAGNDATGTPKWSGEYLTVWRKDADGAWRVVTDCGYDATFATRLPGLTGAPVTSGREREHHFRSADGELSAALGTWWASDADGTEVGGKFLSVGRREADGTHALVVETGILQARR